jgi:hypothetical protein
VVNKPSSRRNIRASRGGPPSEKAGPMKAGWTSISRTPTFDESTRGIFISNSSDLPQPGPTLSGDRVGK